MALVKLKNKVYRKFFSVDASKGINQTQNHETQTS